MQLIKLSAAVSLGVCLAAFTAFPAHSSQPNNAAHSGTGTQSFVFTVDHSHIVRDYYGNKGSAVSLPPGIQRNLARGKSLPPGIAKQALPDDLLRRLPPVDSGLEYLIVGGKLLLVDAATQMIHRVLMEAVFD